MKKHKLLREDILPAMASNRKVQRLLNEFMDLLSEYKTTNTIVEPLPITSNTDTSLLATNKTTTPPPETNETATAPPAINETPTASINTNEVAQTDSASQPVDEQQPGSHVPTLDQMDVDPPRTNKSDQTTDEMTS